MLPMKMQKTFSLSCFFLTFLLLSYILGFYCNVDSLNLKYLSASLDCLLHCFVGQSLGIIPTLPEDNGLTRVSPSAVIYCVIIYFNNKIACSALPQNERPLAPIFVMPHYPFVVASIHFVIPLYMVPEAGIEPARSMSERF